MRRSRGGEGRGMNGDGCAFIAGLKRARASTDPTLSAGLSTWTAGKMEERAFHPQGRLLPIRALLHQPCMPRPPPALPSFPNPRACTLPPILLDPIKECLSGFCHRLQAAMFTDAATRTLIHPRLNPVVPATRRNEKCYVVQSLQIKRNGSEINSCICS
jgi:hypothetical protein